MRNLNTTLQNSDLALLPVLAERWQVNIQNLDSGEIIKALHAAMLEPERVERVWDGLDDSQRGALQTLLGAGGKMTLAMFSRLFGEIRKMGAAGIERDKPHQNPDSIAEALYYRGLIAETFEQAETGARPVIYIPLDLAALLPAHKTGYDAESLSAVPADTPLLEEEPKLEALELAAEIQHADTSVVDDLTTLLAYLQLRAPTLSGMMIEAEDAETLKPFLLKTDPIRLAFLLGIGLSAELIEIQDGRAYTQRTEVRRWLSGKRAEQVRQLAEAWRSSTAYVDLWHVSGLHPEPTGWPYDPVVARGAMLSFMHKSAPLHDWWSLDEFIITMKEVDPDFQRPGGDYDSWYIRNDAGEYLDGFESWDAVEGALLEFYVLGPMHWLGLVDLAEDAARLTVYGRAFVGESQWPNPSEIDDKIIVQDDGTLVASRKVSRIDRFQMARFTTWLGASDPYRYRLDAQGIQRAAEQGITTEHITAFLKRVMEDAPMPTAVARLLSTWQSGPATSVSIERLLVLRTTSPETLDAIWDAPALRRHLGARLGPMAAVVRTDRWEALRDALGEQGIEVEWVNL